VFAEMFLVFFLASDGGREKLEWLHVASVKIRGKRLKAGE